jgi:hypothetical protein
MQALVGEPIGRALTTAYTHGQRQQRKAGRNAHQHKTTNYDLVGRYRCPSLSYSLPYMGSPATTG